MKPIDLHSLLTASVHQASPSNNAAAMTRMRLRVQKLICHKYPRMCHDVSREAWITSEQIL